jgi:hypothetical protein
MWPLAAGRPAGADTSVPVGGGAFKGVHSTKPVTLTSSTTVPRPAEQAMPLGGGSTLRAAAQMPAAAARG